MMSYLSRRRWIAGACFVLLVLPGLLLGCGRFGGDDRPELVVWFVGGLTPGRKAMLHEFERRSGMKVIASIQTDGMDPQRLMCAIAGGAVPDVVYQDRFAVGQWAARDAFMPLDDFAKDSPEIRPENFYEACWAEAQYDGKLYAVPDSTDNRALYYNKDHLSRAGYVDDDGDVVPPRTWEELEEYAVTLSEYDSHGNLTRAGFIPNYGNSWLYMYGWQAGGQFMSDDARTCTLDDPPIVRALQFMVDIYDAVGQGGPESPGAAQVDAFAQSFEGGERDPFFTGKVSMKIDGNWVLGQIADFAPNLNYGVAPAPVPKGNEYITWSGGFSWTIPVGVEDADASWEFIEWMTSEEAYLLEAEVQSRYNQSRGKTYVPSMTARRDVNQQLFETYVEGNPDLPPSLSGYFKLFMDLMEVSKYRPVCAVGQLLWDEHVRAWERATRHEMSPEAALELGAETVQAQLDQVYEDSPGPIVNWYIPLWGTIACIVIGAGVIIWRTGWRPSKGIRSETAAGYLFTGPWLLGFIVLIAGPIIVSIIFSFCRYDVIHAARWIGMENYTTMLAGGDPTFWKSLWNTLFMMLGVPLGMAVGLAIAMLLNTKVAGMSFYRTVYYLPAIVPTVASAILWIWVFNPSNGMLNAVIDMTINPILEQFGTHWSPKWLADPGLWCGSKMAIIIMMLWGAGAGMIIWLAGLQGIPQHLYDAAIVDGAGPWHRFRHVTIPQLTPYIFFNLIMGIIGTLQIFEQSYIMTQGGPVDSTLFYVYYLFNKAFRYFEMGFASAQAWVLFVIILVLTLIQLKLAKHWVYYESD
jgi:multiple sugar transport system permease protein